MVVVFLAIGCFSTFKSELEMLDRDLCELFLTVKVATELDCETVPLDLEASTEFEVASRE